MYFFFLSFSACAARKSDPPTRHTHTEEKHSAADFILKIVDYLAICMNILGS
jgi:hypothetical protein